MADLINKKFLDAAGLGELWEKIKTTFVTNVEFEQASEGKQDIITNLTEIQAGAAAGSTAVQPEDLANVAFSGSYNDLENKPSIPNDAQIANWGYLKSDGLIESAQKDSAGNIITETYVTKTELTNQLNALPEPMIFKGSLGQGGTITQLPTASLENEGFTYKVITDGTYDSQAAEAGDIFISNGSEWILITSGDGANGTVTNVATGIGLTGGPITSTGTIKVKLQSESPIAGENVYPIAVDANGNLVVQVNSITYTLERDGDSILLVPSVGNPVEISSPVYDEATSEISGLMSAEDKAALDEALEKISDFENDYVQIPEGGTSGQILRKNSNGEIVWSEDSDTTYSVFGASGVNASSGLVPAPSSAAGATKYLREDGTWAVPQGQSSGGGSITYDPATYDADGLMTSADKIKLDNIATNANNYVHPVGGSANLTSNLYKISTDATSHINSAVAVSKSDIVALGIPSENTTYDEATSDSAGLMSAEDKAALDEALEAIANFADEYMQIPEGGTSGQILRKNSDGEIVWDEDSDTTYSIERDGDVISLVPSTGDSIEILAPATEETAGLMSAEDKAILDELASGGGGSSEGSTDRVLFATNITGTGSQQSFTINHGLGTKDVVVQVRENTTTNNDIITCDITVQSVDSVVVYFAEAPAAGDIYRVIVQTSGLSVVPGIPETHISRVVAENVTVSNWTLDSNPYDSTYPYYSDVTVVGMTADHYPEIVFDKESLSLQILAPFCNSYEGVVRIYATSEPEDSVFIKQIYGCY